MKWKLVAPPAGMYMRFFGAARLRRPKATPAPSGRFPALFLALLVGFASARGPTGLPRTSARQGLRSSALVFFGRRFRCGKREKGLRIASHTLILDVGKSRFRHFWTPRTAVGNGENGDNFHRGPQTPTWGGGPPHRCATPNLGQTFRFDQDPKGRVWFSICMHLSPTQTSARPREAGFWRVPNGCGPGEISELRNS